MDSGEDLGLFLVVMHFSSLRSGEEVGLSLRKEWVLCPEYAPAWHVLKLCFEIDGVTPLCIGNDLTSLMKEIVQKPWIV